jgi:glycine/D-amino acid oxidase-like deaminating enzyme
MQVDVLVIGQGMAGSLLAWTLLKHEMSVMVVDIGGQNASQVAAGLINPVTGLRLVKTTDVETLLPAAMRCYRQLQDEFKQAFFVARPMLRVLKSASERELANRRLAQSEYQAFLRACGAPPAYADSGYGALEQQQTGYLRTRSLLNALRDSFISRNVYRQARVDYWDVTLSPRAKWLDIEAGHIVFCEGYQGMKNPWFGGLPFQPAKGEILTCRTHSELPEPLVNFGRWLLPTGAHDFKLGATFQPGCTNATPSDAARRDLLSDLSKLLPGLEPDVLEQQAGVRPATSDKQPFIGSHPRHSRLHIFNGFGAKGSLAIPWHAEQFALALQEQTPLPAKASVARFYDTHFAG